MNPWISAPPANPPWLITFVDLVMLLLTFFVLLFSVSKPVPEQFDPVVKAYAEAFGGTSDRGVGQAIGQPLSSAHTPDDKGDDLVYLESVLRPAFERSTSLSGFQFRRTSQYLILALPADALFTGAQVRADARPLVFDLAGVLSNVSNPLAVVGRGKTWALGLNRAEQLAAALTASGLASRLTMLSRDGDEDAIEIVLFARGDRT
jgi:chemotaxis protein MotB